MASANGCLLSIEALITGYGKRQVLTGVDLELSQGETVALIGHNGAGKSTLLKAVFGLLPIWEGRVCLDGREMKSITPRQLRRCGMAYVPQGNRVFNDLSVGENLAMGAFALCRAHSNEGIDRALSLFPALKPRLRQRAETLSGGEKQMLAFANALILSPRMLLLDEPSLGLAQPLTTEVLQRVRAIAQESGTGILVVEQKVREVLRIADRVYVLRNGRVSYSGSAEALRDEFKLREVYL